MPGMLAACYPRCYPGIQRPRRLHENAQTVREHHAQTAHLDATCWTCQPHRTALGWTA